MADEPVMTDDEKNLQLRRDWDEFYNTNIVHAIVQRKGKPHNDSDDGGDLITRYAHTEEFDASHFKYLQPASKYGNVVSSLIKLIAVAKNPPFGGYDGEVKKTYDLIYAANQEIGKVFVSEKLLKQNLKVEWDKFTHEQLANTLAIKDDTTLENASSFFLEPTELMILDEEFTKYSNSTKKSLFKDFKNLWLSATNLYANSSTDKGKKDLYGKIRELNVSKLAIDKALVEESFKTSSQVPPQVPPTAPISPLHISISGNKYSVGFSNANGSHEMMYQNGCWNEKLTSGGATKSKRKKRGLKSKSSTKSSAKSSAKSRPKS